MCLAKGRFAINTQGEPGVNRGPDRNLYRLHNNAPGSPCDTLAVVHDLVIRSLSSDQTIT
jgi:hypothetical protein